MVFLLGLILERSASAPDSRRAVRVCYCFKELGELRFHRSERFREGGVSVGTRLLDREG
jgi:hypothetical protein